MQDLRGSHHVPDTLRFQIVEAIIDCRDIGGGIIKSAVAFANDAWLIRQLRDIAKENDNRALADLGNSGLEQAFDYAWELVVVKAFAALDVVMNIEQFVHVVEILHGEGDAFVPDVDVFLVAGLQLHQLLAAGFPNLRIACRSFIRLLINANNLGQRIPLKRSLIQEIFPAVNDHPKLSPPVADMIIADHFVSEKFGDPRQRIAQHDAANVADVHRLGHVGRSEINHDAFLQHCFGNADPFIAQDLYRFVSDRVGTQRKIDEAGASDYWWLTKIVNIEMRDDFL